MGVYNHLMKTTSLICIVGLAISLSSCKATPPPAETNQEPGVPSYTEEIQAWRVQREEKLRAPDGWLSLVGLNWLEDGDNVMGSDPASEVFLDAPGIPEDVGTISLEDGQVILTVETEGEITLDGESVEETTPLLSDADEGGPSKLHIGRLTAYVIKRGDRFAVRVKDPDAPNRKKFSGIQYFPIDPAFNVEARLHPFQTPRDVTIPTAVGTEDHMLCPGTLRFTINGQEMTLQPWIETPEDRNLFIVFTDGTSGHQTYGAGRFLSAELREDGTATLDFNKAITPPCGFTPFATCPLAPPENAMPIEILAGEQLLGH